MSAKPTKRKFNILQYDNTGKFEKYPKKVLYALNSCITHYIPAEKHIIAYMYLSKMMDMQRLLKETTPDGDELHPMAKLKIHKEMVNIIDRFKWLFDLPKGHIKREGMPKGLDDLLEEAAKEAREDDSEGAKGD